MNHIAISVFFLLFGHIALFAQNDFARDYTPLQPMADSTSEALAQLKARYDSDKLALKSYKGTAREELQYIYEDRYESIKWRMQYKHFYSDPALTAYFRNILNEIYRGNPSIPASEIRFFISRSPWANAACEGEGTITFNFNCLQWLHNESEVAFIICHELAHQQLNHVNNKLNNNIVQLYSKETQQKLRQIYRSGYRVNSQAAELLKTMVYSTKKHSRTHEGEADSLGLVFLKNTSYHPGASLSALMILDSVDKERYDIQASPENWFNFKDYPFKEEWHLEEEGLSMFLVDKKSSFDGKLDEDSLKTHPDCEVRVQKLKGSVPIVDKPYFLQPQQQWESWVHKADFEVIESDLFFDNYSKALYHTLQLLKKYPKNVYLITTVGKIFHLLHKAQKEHEFGKYVEENDSEFDEHYQEILAFLNSLSLNDFPNIGYRFMGNYSAEASNNEDFLYYYLQLAKGADQIEIASMLKKEYLERFPKGKYKDQM
ncbi:MAG: M48 family metalloprotease [Chitinophagales bacterium]|nr:M48 family metalloprotease [Chitinophagales bacterium]